MKAAHIFTLCAMVFVITLSAFVPDVFASHNENLIVSAENPLTDNIFGGAMVLEVIVDDPEFSSTVTDQPEPDVTVNGKDLRMVQAIDGKWYGYFADLNSAKLADSTVALPGFGLDFGEFCQNHSVITGLVYLDTAGFAIPRDIPTGSNGLDFLGVCSEDITTEHPFINHVVRESKDVNLQPTLPGQIGINVDAWPFIQLFHFNPTGNVEVKYNKGGGVEEVVLKFDEENQSYFKTDSTLYINGEQVKITINNDVKLNIDPTDEDSWTFGTNPSSPSTYYQLFDENGQADADGTAGAVNIFSLLESLMFEDGGFFLIDPALIGTDTVNLSDNDLQQIIPGLTIGDAVSVGGTMTTGSHPITFTETYSNSNTFVNFDNLNIANLYVRLDAPRASQAVLSYNDAPFSILAVEPKDLIGTLKFEIQKLVNSDSLAVKDANKLTKNLDKFLNQFENEKIDRACNELDKFNKKVDKLISKDKLVDGSLLNELANRVQASIGCQ